MALGVGIRSAPYTISRILPYLVQRRHRCLAGLGDGGRDAVGLLLVDAVAEPRLSRVLLDYLQDGALASLVGQTETKIIMTKE